MAAHAATLKQQQMNLLKATNAANSLLHTHDARTMTSGSTAVKIDLIQIDGKNSENPSHTPRGTNAN